MEQNPYPKEVSSPPTVKAGVAFGVLLLLSIPAGCISGGITCWTTGIVGEATVEQHGGPVDAGFVVGIPIGLIITVLVPTLTYFFLGRRKNDGIHPPSEH
jgi:hypothetical protein